MNRYDEMQMFLNTILEFVFENSDKKVDNNLIYSLMCHYYTIDNLSSFVFEKHRIVQDNYYQKWIDRYENIKKRENVDITVSPWVGGKFVNFSSGYTKNNEIKMYIPLDYNHIYEGANRLFDFIIANKITHNSKIASFIRSDNVVVRIDTLADMEKIINFVNNDSYIREGMLKVNPFLANYNGIGLAMDNCYSYNTETAKIIASFLNNVLDSTNYYTDSNGINIKRKVKDLFTVENFHNYLEKMIPMMQKKEDEDLVDIISLLSKTTSKNFSINDFYNHANKKLIDKYDYGKQKIIDPLFYLERAININSIFYPGYEIQSLNKLLIDNNFDAFTRKEYVRDSLLKYIAPLSKTKIINMMKEKLKDDNIYFSLFSKKEEIIKTFVNVTIKENKDKEEYQEIRRKKASGYYEKVYNGQNLQPPKESLNYENNRYEQPVNKNDSQFIFYNDETPSLSMHDKFKILKNACLNVNEKESQFLSIMLLELMINHRISPQFLSGDRDEIKKFIDDDIKAIIMYGINIDGINVDKTGVIIKQFIDEINLEKNKNRKL